ncbi:MAG: hypothetical protein ACLSUW_01045 [Akkermansia sp.]
MKIAVIGKGGREHALVKALKESPSAPEMYCFPGVTPSTVWLPPSRPGICPR